MGKGVVGGEEGEEMMLLQGWRGWWLWDDHKLMGPFDNAYSACSYYNHSMGCYPDFV